MSNVKKVIICILAIALVVLVIRTDVFAADDLFNAFATGNENTTPEQIENRGNQNVENVNSNKDSNTNTNTNTNKNVNNNKSNMSNASEHADAGVDYSIVFIIAICGISAVYAYKKIRQYNV